MGITAVITDRKFYTEFKNGVGFGASTGDYTTNLTGSVMEKIKLVQTIRVDWFTASLNGDRFVFMAAGHVKRDFNSFIDDGFAIGDTFHYLDDYTGTIIFTGTVTALTDLDLYYTVDTLVEPTPGTIHLNYYFRGTTVLKSLAYKFGIIENSEATNYIHKATGKEQSYTFKDLTASTTGLPTSGVKVWETGSITCSTGVVTDVYFQTFTVTHYFTIPYYESGYETNLEDGTLPADFDGTNSFKYVCQYQFRAAFSNPNGQKVGTDDKNLGSVAFFNENFNGLAPQYELLSIVYTDVTTALPVAGIQKAGTTRISCNIGITSGSFSSGDSTFGIYISKLPAVAQNLADTFNQLFIYGNVLGTTDAAVVVGAGIITNYSAVTDGGGTFITVQFDIAYDTNQRLRIELNDTYVLGIQCGLSSLTNQLSNKVTVLSSFQEYVVNADVEGLLTWRDVRFYNHLQNYPDVSVDLSGSRHGFKGWIEDGVLINAKFDLDLSKQPRIEGLEFAFIAYNIVTNEYWVIQTYNFNTNLKIFGSIGAYFGDRFNIDTVRDFNLPAGDQFNLIKLKSADALMVDSFLNYNCVATFKIDWQKWINNPNVDTSFYDSTQLFNNFNQHVSNYIGGEWRLKFLITATLNSSSDLLVPLLTKYEFLSPNCLIYDYLKDGNTPPKWLPVVTTHSEDGTENFNGRIRKDVKTLMKIVWTFNSATYGSMDDSYNTFEAIHRIEPHYALSSNQIEELSTLRTNLAQKLKGVVGQTSPHKTKLTIGVNVITTECLIDNTQLNPNLNYKLSGRLFAESGSEEGIGFMIIEDTFIVA